MYDPATGELVADTGIVTSPDLNELAAALAKAQGVIEDAKKSTDNTFTGKKYADLGSVWDAIRQPLSANNLALIQLPVPASRGMVGIHTRLVHSSGQYIGSTAYIPCKDDAQGHGSGLTYLRRYMAMALVGVAPGDDDGIGAMPQQQQTQPPRQEQRPPQQPVRPIPPRPQPITRESLAEKAVAANVSLERHKQATLLRDLIKTCNDLGGSHPPLTIPQVQGWSDAQFESEIAKVKTDIETLQAQLATSAAKGH